MKITRRTFVAGIGATAALAGTGAYLWPRRNLSNRPNIIVFIADDMRYDSISSSLASMPNLGALAKHSQNFSNAFVTTSVCTVSRASMLTGTYKRRHHLVYSDHQLSASLLASSYPAWLKTAGYHTGFIGKWGFMPPKKNPFDVWSNIPTEGPYYHKGVHLTDAHTAKALSFLDTAPDYKSFLLVVAYKAPHLPFVPQKRFQSLYSDQPVPRQPTDTEDAFNRMPELLKTSRGRRDYKRHKCADDNHYQEAVRNYYRLLAGVDDSIGQVMAKVKAKGLEGNTCVVFTSDNGMMLGDHGLLGKWCMYEESMRVPLIMHVPGTDPATIPQMALNIDIAPTILSLASLKIPRTMQGKSLLPLTVSKDTPWRDGFYYEHSDIKSGLMVGANGYREAQWKYTRYFRGSKQQECLFNLADDPHELNNLAKSKEHKATLKKMRRKTQKAKKAAA